MKPLRRVASPRPPKRLSRATFCKPLATSIQSGFLLRNVFTKRHISRCNRFSPDVTEFFDTAFLALQAWYISFVCTPPGLGVSELHAFSMNVYTHMRRRNWDLLALLHRRQLGSHGAKSRAVSGASVTVPTYGTKSPLFV